jgi:hypothetical protein
MLSRLSASFVSRVVFRPGVGQGLRSFASSGAHRAHPSLIQFTHGKFNEANLKKNSAASANFFETPVSSEERELLLNAPRTRQFLTEQQMELIELGGAKVE